MRILAGKMEDDGSRLIRLFEKKINLLLEKNEGYSRFKEINPLRTIQRLISQEVSREGIMDLGFLLHLYALNFRLTMYKNLTPFTILSFKKDLQEIINVLHAYSRHRGLLLKPTLELTEADESKELIPPLIDMCGSKRLSTDNPELYNVILDVLEGDVRKVDIEIPKDIIREMQQIDLKIIYNGLPEFIEEKRFYTVRKLANNFPVFKNDRLSLVAVFNEVLFLANEGKVCLRQMDNDIGISVSI
jgi:hypothetical protein